MALLILVQEGCSTFTQTRPTPMLSATSHQHTTTTFQNRKIKLNILPAKPWSVIVIVIPMVGGKIIKSIV